MRAEQDAQGSGGKLRWLSGICGECGDSNLLKEADLRALRMISQRGGKFGVFRSESRFVTGLGRSHPVENGFAWHPTLGTPYLAGSSIKGMIRAWAAEEAVDPLELDELLGSGGEKGAAGALIVLDALPRRPVTLEVDVLTPHYAGWTPDSPPGDWRSPVPVPFLVVAEGAEFLFGIQPRGKVSKGALERVWRWLEEALVWAGAGAKTAVGYGRFEPLELKTSQCIELLKEKKICRRQRLAETPEERWLVEVERCDEGKVLTLVRVNLINGGLQNPVERRAFIAAVEATGYVDCWRRGKAKTSTGRGKKKLKEYGRLIREP